MGKFIYLDNKSYCIVGVVEDWDYYIKYYDLNNGVFNSLEKFYVFFFIVFLEEIGMWGNINGWKYEILNGY